MKRRWVVSMGVALGLWAGRVSAQEMTWRPAPAPPQAVGTWAGRVIASTPDRAAAMPSALAAPRSPAAALQRPVPIAATPQRPSVTAVSYSQPAPIIRCQDTAPPPVPPPGVPLIGAEDPFNCGVVPGPPPVGGGDPFLGGRVGPLLTETNPARAWFQSDHCFDQFASPVSNPFLAEDPRALTELRPIFIYQKMPNSNWGTNGGSTGFFATQARLAITDRWSIVLNKLGGVWMDPNNQNFFREDTGFAELWIGPKFTFWRCEPTGTVAAFGLTFQIPVGSDKVFQDTGDLSLSPYVSLAQTFGRSSYGAFNFMSTIGYNFRTDSTRTDYLYSQLHLDYDVANLHKFYPLVELNWFYYTKNGGSGNGAQNFDFEGGDLFNLGSGKASSNNFMSLALGGRYKFTECVQLGAAFEFPVSGRKDLMDYRFTVDLIFRY